MEKVLISYEKNLKEVNDHLAKGWKVKMFNTCIDRATSTTTNVFVLEKEE